MGLVDENLWHRAPPAAGEHFLTGSWSGLDIDLLDLDTLGRQQLARPRTIGAPVGGIDLDCWPGHDGEIRSALRERQILGLPPRQSAAQAEGLGESLGGEFADHDRPAGLI